VEDVTKHAHCVRAHAGDAKGRGAGEGKSEQALGKLPVSCAGGLDVTMNAGLYVWYDGFGTSGKNFLKYVLFEIFCPFYRKYEKSKIVKKGTFF